VLTDVVHSIGVCLFRVGELVNPDRLRHVGPSKFRLHCGTRADA
jgi:hypothetical protein